MNVGHFTTLTPRHCILHCHKLIHIFTKYLIKKHFIITVTLLHVVLFPIVFLMSAQNDVTQIDMMRQQQIGVGFSFFWDLMLRQLGNQFRHFAATHWYHLQFDP